MSVKPIPDGYHTLTPFLTISDAEKAIEFYQKLLEPRSRGVMKGPDGKIMHAEIEDRRFDHHVVRRISPLSVRCLRKRLGGSSMRSSHLCGRRRRCIRPRRESWSEVEMPVMDQFWGDRYGRLKDPFGHKWSLATHKQDLSPEEMKKGMDEAMAQFAKKN